MKDKAPNMIHELFSKKVMLSTLMVFISVWGMATTYYVSNGGNDLNTGLSKGLPWKTLNKVSNSTFQPGDSILLKRGDLWRETLSVSSSGSASRRIVISSYGTGNKPRILGSQQPLSWTNQGGNIWKSDANFANDIYNNGAVGGGNIWSINSDGTANTGIYQSSVTAITADNMWSWNGNSVYFYSTSNPGTRYSNIEIQQRSIGILLNHKEYIEINGIDIFFTGVGIYEGYPSANVNGLTIRNCELGYFGYPHGNASGIHAFYSNSLIEKNVIHDCGRRGISLTVIGSGFTFHNVIIQDNTFYHGYHTTSVDLQGTSGYSGNVDSVFIRHNLIYEAPDYNSPAYPMQMFLSDQGATNSMTNIFVYNNVFKYASGASISINGIESLNIYNNTFYGHNEIRNAASAFLFVTATHMKVKNNIFYSQLSSDTNGNGLAYLVGASSDVPLIESDYNCYYRPSTTLGMIKCASPYSAYASQDSTNLRTNYKWEVHSIFKDPKLVSSIDLSLQTGSVCRQSGTNVGLPYTGSAPDIGTYQTNITHAAIVSYNLSDPVVCFGKSAIIKQDGSQVGMSYQLQSSSGSTVGNAVLGTGTAIQYSLTPLSSGTYQVKVTRISDGEKIVMPDIALLTVKQVPAPLGKPSGVSSIVIPAGKEYEYTIKPLDNADNYTWSISPSGSGLITGNTTSAKVRWNDGYTGLAYIMVSASNVCGTSSSLQALEITMTKSSSISTNIQELYPDKAWDPQFISQYPQAEFLIYDVNGRIITRIKATEFTLKEFKNDESTRSGVYVYVFLPNNGEKAIKGKLSIVR